MTFGDLLSFSAFRPELADWRVPMTKRLESNKIGAMAVLATGAYGNVLGSVKLSKGTISDDMTPSRVTTNELWARATEVAGRGAAISISITTEALSHKALPACNADEVKLARDLPANPRQIVKVAYDSQSQLRYQVVPIGVGNAALVFRSSANDVENVTRIARAKNLRPVRVFCGLASLLRAVVGRMEDHADADVFVLTDQDFYFAIPNPLRSDASAIEHVLGSAELRRIECGDRAEAEIRSLFDSIYTDAATTATSCHIKVFRTPSSWLSVIPDGMPEEIHVDAPITIPFSELVLS